MIKERVLEETSDPNDFSISLIYKVLWQSKKSIIAFTLICAIGSAVFALSRPNIYTSRAILTNATSNQSAMSSIAGQLGGLASLAGVSLGNNNSVHAMLEQLQSKDFLYQFIEKRALVVPLFAATGWDPVGQKLLYEDLSIYDASTKQWLRTVNYPRTQIPSKYEAIDKFMEHFHVDMDRKTKIINISLDFLSPEMAQQWLSWLLLDFNEYMRTKDIEEFKINTGYLESQIQKTNITAMHEVFYSLIQEQVKSAMLAEVQKEYAVRIIDSPSLAIKKSAPIRSVIVLASTLLGGLLASGAVLILYFRKRKQSISVV